MSVSNLVGQDVLKLVEVWSQECSVEKGCGVIA